MAFQQLCERPTLKRVFHQTARSANVVFRTDHAFYAALEIGHLSDLLTRNRTTNGLYRHVLIGGFPSLNAALTSLVQIACSLARVPVLRDFQRSSRVVPDVEWDSPAKRRGCAGEPELESKRP